MNRITLSICVGLALFALWYFVVLNIVWMRDGMSIAMGASLAVNVSLLTWLVSAPRAAAPQHEDSTKATR